MPRFPATIETISSASIASKVGLKKGDHFVELQGQSVTYFDEVKAIMTNLKSDSIQFKVKRDQQVLAFKEPLNGDSTIGFTSVWIEKEGLKDIQYSLGESIAIGPGRAFDVIWLQIKAFKRIFSGDISFKKSLSGPIGMAQMYGGVWDWERFWRMTGLLSMVLAFMNFLPIPALDGGYVMFLLYEMVSGREPSEKFFENAIKVGMAILLLLMVFVFYNDIAKLFTGG
jgi:regulator of sigma E protease